MRKNLSLVLVLLGLTLVFTACSEKTETGEKIIEDLPEEKKEGEKNLVRSEDIEGNITRMVKDTAEKKEYDDFNLDGVEVWVYKDQDKKIYLANISMSIKKLEGEEAEKLFKESSRLIESKISNKYEYEELNFSWVSPDYSEDNKKEIIYYN